MRDQPGGLVERSGHGQDDCHLRDFGEEGGAQRDHRVEQPVCAVAAQQVEVQGAADQAFHGCGHGASACRESTHVIAVDASGQADRQTDTGAAENAAEHRANGAGVGNRALDLESEVGAHDAESGKNDVADQLVRQAHRDLHQRSKQRCFAEQVGDHQIDTHLLHQAADQRDVVDFLEFEHGGRPRAGRADSTTLRKKRKSLFIFGCNELWRGRGKPIRRHAGFPA